MDLELSVSGHEAKAQVLAVLTQAGFRAGSGSVRLAYPFAVRVEGLDEHAGERACALVRNVDPGAGRIVATGILTPRAP